MAMRFSGMSAESADILRNALGVESAEELDEEDAQGEEDGDEAAIDPDDNDVVHSDDDQIEAVDDLDKDNTEGGELMRKTIHR